MTDNLSSAADLDRVAEEERIRRITSGESTFQCGSNEPQILYWSKLSDPEKLPDMGEPFDPYDGTTIEELIWAVDLILAKNAVGYMSQNKRELLKLLRDAVSLVEQSWDAQRDVEMELQGDIDGLSGFIEDLAVSGADSVTMDNVEELLQMERTAFK